MFRKLIFLMMLLFSAAVIAKPIHIIAAENFYGDIAKQIGGQYVQVLSIMNNPNQDPHLFSANISTAKSIADADVIIYNGLGYDPWMDGLISADAKQNRVVIVVADLANKKSGDNPHIWYDPHIILLYAENLTQHLIKLDANHQQYYQQSLDEFKKSNQQLLAKMNMIKNQYKNMDVIATEPIFDYMSDMLGLKMLGEEFQLSIMNNTSPSVDETKDFEDILRQHKVRLLIYNKQVSNPVTTRMQAIARQSNIPVVGVSETQPIGEDYVGWMTSQLDSLEKALK